ncbi:hypothetical protein [Halomonas elongata]|nr:hypothetical protein [Halomonas elongata]
MCLGIDYPVLEGYDLSRFRLSCYLLELDGEQWLFSSYRIGGGYG